MKYGVNRVTLVGNVGEVPKVSERDGEAFVANFPLATNDVWKDKEGEEVSKTEWQHSVVYDVIFQFIYPPIIAFNP
jgi:single-strand DNA-binding protein